jgi:Zn-dependent protease with chaperone function
MTRSFWLAARAVLAIALMVAFYVLAVAVAGGLLWIAYYEVTSARRVAARLVLFCVVGAGSILWAILPRRDRFEAPGPLLAAREQPDLFALIRDTARATEQAEPDEVYLTNDVNAFVSQRGGVMGAGARRVMGLGLPLMQALNVDEFKAVLTHEFGHYHAGDVALGPWLYKTQAAIARTIAQLSGSVLRFVFIPFAALFFRVTHAVSRRQEFIADELAATVVGPDAMAGGLRKVNAAALAYQSYWYAELVPVLQAGYRPPVASGFRQYAASPRLGRLFEAMAAEHETAATTAPYDTHPSLGERVAALRRHPPRAVQDQRPATALLADLDTCEKQLFERLSDDFAGLKPVTWPAVTEAVYLPMWRARVKQHGALLAPFTVASPPATASALQGIGAQIAGGVDADRQIDVAWQLVVAAFALALAPLGWIAETSPGDEVVLRRNGDEIRPYGDMSAIVTGERTLADWQMRCAVLGIAAIPLGAAAVSTGGA